MVTLTIVDRHFSTVRCFILAKTFVLNLENLETTADAQKIENHFLKRPGVEKVAVELGLKIVSLHYNEDVGSPHKLLEAFTKLGYPVK